MLYEYVIPLDVIITIDTHHIYINNIIYVIYNKIYKTSITLITNSYTQLFSIYN